MESMIKGEMRGILKRGEIGRLLEWGIACKELPVRGIAC